MHVAGAADEITQKVGDGRQKFEIAAPSCAFRDAAEPEDFVVQRGHLRIACLLEIFIFGEIRVGVFEEETAMADDAVGSDEAKVEEFVFATAGELLRMKEILHTMGDLLGDVSADGMTNDGEEEFVDEQKLLR